MRTAKTRGFSAIRRSTRILLEPVSCSWFESRYPSKIPDQSRICARLLGQDSLPGVQFGVENSFAVLDSHDPAQSLWVSAYLYDPAWDRRRLLRGGLARFAVRAHHVPMFLVRVAAVAAYVPWWQGCACHPSPSIGTQFLTALASRSCEVRSTCAARLAGADHDAPRAMTPLSKLLCRSPIRSFQRAPGRLTSEGMLLRMGDDRARQVRCGGADANG